MTKTELEEFLYNEFYDKKRRAIVLSNLDFTRFECGVDINGMKVFGTLRQCGQTAGRLLQHAQTVMGDLTQDGQKVGGNLSQNRQRVEGDLIQDKQKVYGELVQDELLEKNIQLALEIETLKKEIDEIKKAIVGLCSHLGKGE